MDGFSRLALSRVSAEVPVRFQTAPTGLGTPKLTLRGGFLTELCRLRNSNFPSLNHGLHQINASYQGYLVFDFRASFITSVNVL